MFLTLDPKDKNVQLTIISFISMAVITFFTTSGGHGDPAIIPLNVSTGVVKAACVDNLITFVTKQNVLV